MIDVTNKSERDGLRLLGREYASLCDHIDSLEAVVEAARAYQFDPYNEPNAIALDNALAALDASKGKVKP